ncbi:MAG TPA: pitrilysin family protein [Vicinamibacterales bacterium]|jgi:zinc protease|nr:pitrilysin family protein [Vicinamibacterales bacterium]
MTTAAVRGLSPVRHQLPNGAVALAQESPATPAVTINATMHVGSVDEPPTMLGLSYFTSRLIDRGAGELDADEIAEELEGRGVSLNIAATRHAISITATSLVEDFAAIVDIVSDIVCRPLFPEQQIELRRAEIITQLRQDEDNPAVRAVQALFTLLYSEDHPYGRPPKGTIASIERIDRDALVRFHRGCFSPASLVVAAVGAIDPHAAIDRVTRAFGSFAANGQPPFGQASGSAALSNVTGPSHRCVSVIPMMAKSQADIAYGFVTITRTDPSYYAWWVMNTILGQYGLGGRLGDNIRERQGMAYYAYSAFDPHVVPGPLMVRAGVDGANVDRAIAAIDEEIVRLATSGPEPREIEETQRYLIGSLPRMLETNGGIASFLQTAERFGLGADYDKRLPGLVGSVTREAVHAAAASLSPDRAAVAIAGPYKS